MSYLYQQMQYRPISTHHGWGVRWPVVSYNTCSLPVTAKTLDKMLRLFNTPAAVLTIEYKIYVLTTCEKHEPTSPLHAIYVQLTALKTQSPQRKYGTQEVGGWHATRGHCHMSVEWHENNECRGSHRVQSRRTSHTAPYQQYSIAATAHGMI